MTNAGQPPHASLALNRRNIIQAAIFLSIAAGSAGLAKQAGPRRLYADEAPIGDLEAQIPLLLKGWKGEPQTASFVVDPTLAQGIAEAYDAMLTRQYRDSRGRTVSLVLAYVREVTDTRRVHDPEVCYPAQGFTVLERRVTRLTVANHSLPAVVFTASAEGQAQDRVHYWIVEGPTVAPTNLERKLLRIRLGLSHLTADGLLVRLSTRQASAEEADKLLDDFLLAFTDEVPPPLHAKIFGKADVSI